MPKVIAIDGPSGAGKSTVGRLIAKALGFNYLDTGALYRAVALALREGGIEPDAPADKIQAVLNNITLTFKDGKVFLKEKVRGGEGGDGRDISENIRSAEIDYYSSVFSTKKIVRDFLLNAQRNTTLNNDIVVEGRDTTTVVFPDAWKKIYLDASLEERAKRRYLQFREKGIDRSIDKCREDIMERDLRDSNRDIAPLKKAADAFFIDSSELSVEQVVEKILEFIRAKL